ncbi:tetraspanin-18 [Salvia miltiorrhiza]|uniref:tetraspanin-18 n=1 Tax=Salvia miltiorrhiza TaxID=226208 RepID=UPI0025AC52BC|nr:tetraspanin-18 [Salvia miltiorrhiza]
MRTPCSHTFLAFILKFLNFLTAFVGVVIIIYSAYVLNQLQHHQNPFPPPNQSGFRPNSGVFNPDDALSSNFTSLPAPWFTYAFMGIGILTCFISFIGFIGAEAISGCCLCFYAVLTTIFILSEVGLVTFIALDHQWEKDIPSDPTGEIDTLWTFIKENADVFMWVGIVIVTIQVLSVLLAIVLRSLVSSENEDDDIEGEYGFRKSTREPLLSPYSGQASGSTRGDSDIWSSRMREKYGLNTSSDTKPKFGESKSIS